MKCCIVFIILCYAFLTGMGGTTTNPSDSEHYREKLRQVDSSDGISKEEAIIIAQNYLINEKADKSFALDKARVRHSDLIDECWAVKFPRTWKEQLEHGPLWEVVHIDKTTGEIKSSGGWPDL